MAVTSQATETPESEISVDMNAADPARAVTRRSSSDIARGVRDDGPAPRTKTEKELFKRMGRLERNIEAKFNQQLADREAAWQRERSELKAQVDRLSVDRSGDEGSGDATHDAAMKKLEDELAAAYEKGDSMLSAQITAKMTRLDNQFWARKAAGAGVTTREAAAETRTQTPPPAAKTSGPTAAGSRFITANEDWWEDPEFAVEKGAANTLYLKLINEEGFDPKSEETFKEIARQMKQKFPALPVRAGRKSGDDDDPELDEETETQELKPRRQAPAGRIDDRGDASPRNRGTLRTLSKQEIDTMRACRLDPDNDRDVVTFLKEAVNLESQS